MKVGGKVVEKHGGDYSFMTCKMKSGQNEIPLGAKVTIEWEMEHRCRELDELDNGMRYITKSDNGLWYLYFDGQFSRPRVNACPGCGEKLA